MRFPTCTLLVIQLCGAGFCQTASILITEGDPVPGVGAVTRIDHVDIGSDGTVLVEVDTDNSDTDADGVLLRNGVLFLREGQALAAPAGASIGSFDGTSLSASGQIGLNLFLDGTAGTNDNSGLFLGSSLLIQEGATSAAFQFAAGTIYTGFFDVAFSDPSSLLVMASVDDPSIATTTDRALVMLSLDAAGNVVGETVVAKEGDILPGQSEPVADFETGAEEYAANAFGSTMFTADLAGDTAVDRAVYLNQTLLMQEGSPSPIPGRNWGSLASVELDLNDAGSWVAKANLDSSSTTDNEVLVRDGAIFKREGDTLPDIAPFTLTDFGGSIGVFLTPAGDVIWFGDWDDPDTTKDEGLFFNDTLILQEGVSIVGGQTIVDLADFTESMRVSEDGKRLVIEGEINPSGTDLDVAILVELGFGTVYCMSNVNSTGTRGNLAAGGSASTAANDVTLRATNLPPLSFGYYITSLTQDIVQNPGGGDAILCLGGEIGRYSGPGQVLNSGPQGVITLDLDLTQTPQPMGFVSVMAGETWSFQCWFRDVGAGSPTSNMTNGLAIDFF